MINIVRYQPQRVDLYCPNNEHIGVLYNDHELNKVQIQIAEQNLDGYYIIWNGQKIMINNIGELSTWPKGMYDESQRDFAKLYKIRLEKHIIIPGQCEHPVESIRSGHHADQPQYCSECGEDL